MQSNNKKETLKQELMKHDHTKNVRLTGLERKQLNELHKKYVITPTDKVPGNYSIICKKYYIQQLCGECGIKVENGQLKVEGNSNFKPIWIPKQKIIATHKNILAHYGKKF